VINARVGYWLDSQVTVDADAAVITLADITDADEPVFKSFDIQIGCLDAIAGVTPIKNTTFPTKGMGGTWAAELNADFAQEWSDAGASLKLTYYGSIRSFDPYAFSMGLQPRPERRAGGSGTTAPTPRRLDQPLRRVISIASGRAEEITYLAVHPITEDGEEHKSQLFGTGITQSPYEASQEQVQKVNAPLRLKPDEVSLLALARTWQQLTVLHHPRVERTARRFTLATNTRVRASSCCCRRSRVPTGTRPRPRSPSGSRSTKRPEMS
jgi:hypothetical protein